MNVWITGAGGLIGSHLVKAAPPGSVAVGLTRDHVDLNNDREVEELFRNDPPDAIVHCAAISKSPACQADPALAKKTNVQATARLAALASEIPFVFFSSDLVFDGSQGHYVETDPPNPLSVYAETKAAAEEIVLKNPNHTVIRTSLNGGISPTGDRGFNEDLRQAFTTGRYLNLFADEFRSPIPVEFTARAVWALLDRGANGLFHIAGAERLSRFEIGQLIATRWPHLSPKIQATSLKTYEGAPRAPDTSLNCTKAEARLPFQLPGLKTWLRENPEEPF